MIKTTINGIDLIFETSDKLFSPQNIDRGTLAMLFVAKFTDIDKVLDLGCGYGVVGIYAAKLIGEHNVFMSDSDVTAINFARRNAKINGVGGVQIIHSDGFKEIKESGFSIILSNPPYHSDFSVPKRFIEKGFNRLSVGGMMYFVTKRKDWYKNKLTAIFGGVKIHEIDEYYVFCSEKRSIQYARL